MSTQEKLITYRKELMKKTIPDLNELLDIYANEYLEASRIPRYTKPLYINALVYSKCKQNNLGSFSECVDLSHKIAQLIKKYKKR